MIKYGIISIIVLCMLLFYFQIDKLNNNYFSNPDKIDKYTLHFKQEICKKNNCTAFDIYSNLYTMIESYEHDNYIMMFKLDQIQIPQNNSFLIQKLITFYEKPFWIKFDTNGTMVKLFFDSANGDYDGLEQMISYLNIPLFKTNKTMLQHDTIGEFNTSLNYSKNTITKTILNYNKLVNTELFDFINIKKNKFTATYKNTHNWIDSLKGSIKFDLIYKNQILVTNKNTISLTYHESFKNNREKNEFSTKYKDIINNTKNEKPTLIESIIFEQNKLKYQKTSIDTMIVALDSNLIPYSNLKDYLKVFPNKFNHIIDVFHKLSDLQQSRIIGYMSLISDIKEIQQGLITLYNKTPRNANKIRIIITLGMTKQPKKNTISFLKQKLYSKNKEISNSSLLALGTLSIYENHLEEVIINYYKNANSFQKEIALRAMKNGNFKSFQKKYPKIH